MNKKKKNRFLPFLCVLVATTVFIGTIPVMAFSDVNYDYPYSNAISFLETNGIIEGYEDGTYKPEALINRAEFLKIALGATAVKLDNNSSMGFSDTDESAWYAPYIRKAKAEGWVQGYPDGTFKPEQNINKVEALKILGEIQDWDRLALAEVPKASYKDTYRFIWYSPYVYFAKENGLLFEETDYLYPDKQISRGYMAELVYRTITKDVIRYEPDKSVEDKIAQEKQVDTPSTFKIIDKDFFENISLESGIPNVMYKNEIYFINGTFKNGLEEDETFAFLSNSDSGSTKYSHFFGTVEDGKFSIPMVFREPGKFNLGIVPGLAGESKIAEITVLDGIPKEGEIPNDDTPKSINMSFKDDKTSLTWKSDQNNIFRIYFIQDQTIHSYIVRGKKTLDAFYKDFKFFNEGNLKIRVYGAKANSIYPAKLDSKWIAGLDKTFSITKHNFRLSYDDSIVYSTIPEILSDIQKIYVSGTVNEPIFANGAIITPSGKTETFEIQSDSPLTTYYGNDVIEKGSKFSFVYEPTQTGTYILEINDLGGSAVLNIPIYIGHEIPLVPDFFDLQDPMERTSSLNIEEARKELLNYINIERQNHGLSPVSIVSQLDTLAQKHTDDMVERIFFAHINPDGETPNDRRINLSIYTDVGENLAIAPTVYFAHEALMRSAIHRKNILTSYWDTVGIGITKDGDGYLVIAEEFSHDAWTKEDLQKFEYSLLDDVNTNRQKPLVVDIDLQTIARSWSGDMVTQDYFSFVSPTGKNIIDVVKDSGVTNEGRAYILKEGSVESLLGKLIEESDIKEEDWSKIGLGLAQDIWSTLYLTVIFTQ